MSFVVIALCGVMVAELLIRVPLMVSVVDILKIANKAGRTVSSKLISDHWKERILPVYALHMGLGSLKAFGWLLFAFSPFLILSLIWRGDGDDSLAAILLDWRVVVGLTTLCGAYAWFRQRSGGDDADQSGDSQAYSTPDRILHRLALGTPVLPEMVHDIERTVYLKSSPDSRDRPHVFVTGLARAGTTVLLRELYRTGQFAAVTYADMPFVLAPNLWARVANQKNPSALKERAHGDGITVNADSPEAFDEVYWRVLDGAAYIKPDRLVPHVPDAETLEGYSDYISMVLLRRNKTRYLSKNNNNILRLGTLAAAHPKSVFLVPLRAPLQHAASLLRQHRRFAQTDDFTAAYMGWLGHYEFGRDHRPFVFDKKPAGDPDTLDYWLDVWTSSHQHLESVAAQNLHFVLSAKMATDAGVWSKLADILELPGLQPTEIRVVGDKPIAGFDPIIAEKAQQIYDRLSERCLV